MMMIILPMRERLDSKASCSSFVLVLLPPHALEGKPCTKFTYMCLVRSKRNTILISLLCNIFLYSLLTRVSRLSPAQKKTFPKERAQIQSPTQSLGSCPRSLTVYNKGHIKGPIKHVTIIIHLLMSMGST